MELSFLETYDPNIIDEELKIYKATNLLLLAKYCMNIDITKLTIMGTAALSEINCDKASFNPNYRFCNAVKYLKKHNISADGLSKSVIEDIFTKLDFSYLNDYNISFMTQWANNTILKTYSLNDYFYYVAYKEDTDVLETMLSINCYVSDLKYSGQIVAKPSKNDIMYAASYAYICDNNDLPSQVALINVIDGRIMYI